MAEWKIADLVIMGRANTQRDNDCFPIFYYGEDRWDAIKRWLEDTKLGTLAAAMEFAVYIKHGNPGHVDASARLIVNQERNTEVSYPISINMVRQERNEPAVAQRSFADDVKMVAPLLAKEIIRIMQGELDGYQQRKTEMAVA